MNWKNKILNCKITKIVEGLKVKLNPDSDKSDWEIDFISNAIYIIDSVEDIYKDDGIKLISSYDEWFMDEKFLKTHFLLF